MAFLQTVWQYYEENGRHDMPWRQPIGGSFDPYRIMLSEIMLQQTQVARVIPKYEAFLARFPDVAALAAAPLADALALWSGLGYNRRAKFLHQAARAIMQQYQGQLPTELDQLVALPGIGPNTAGAIRAYAFNQPQVFIETNIRSVYIHHFFPAHETVADRDIMPLIQASLTELDNESQTPRTWYWALMDYGSFLKQTEGNASRRSKAFVKQSAFKGSRREIRGFVLRSLGDQPHTKTQLAAKFPDKRLASVLDDLCKEGLIQCINKQYHLGTIA